MTIDTSTWTDEQRAELAALDESIAESTQAEQLAEAKREAARMSPENQLAERRAEDNERKRLKALAAYEVEADSIHRKALLDFGGKERVARIFSEGGSIIFRAMTLAESDLLAKSVEEMTNQSDKVNIVRELTCETLVFPARPVFNEIVSKWPGLWMFIHMARDAMAAGIREDVAKKG